MSTAPDIAIQVTRSPRTIADEIIAITGFRYMKFVARTVPRRARHQFQPRKQNIDATQPRKSIFRLVKL